MVDKKRNKPLTVEGARREEIALYNDIRGIEMELADPRGDDGARLHGNALREHRTKLKELLHEKESHRAVLKAFLAEHGVTRAQLDTYCAAAGSEPPPWVDAFVDRIVQRVVERVTQIIGGRRE